MKASSAVPSATVTDSSVRGPRGAMQSFRQYRLLKHEIRQRLDQDLEQRLALGSERAHITTTIARSSSDQCSVHFEQDDPFNPRDWSKSKKWFVTCIVGAVGLLTSGCAAFDTEVVPQAMREYGISSDTALLATVLYMICFGLGTPFSGPLSETFGRNPVYIISLSVFTLFAIGSAMAPNAATWLVCRSCMGLFGSPPAVAFGGSMSDMWSPTERVYVFPVLAALTFLGPFLAPLAADYIATSPNLSWHFVEWLTLISAGTVLLLVVCSVPETYAPIILSWKVHHLRKMSGDARYQSAGQSEQVGLLKRVFRNAQRPWTFLLEETIVTYFAAYIVDVYIVLFGSLVAFSFVFGRQGAWKHDLAIYYLSQREVGLCYIPMNIGFICALLLCYPIYKRFKNIMIRERCDWVQPEEHLCWAMVGAPLLPASILWLGLTARTSIPLWCPLVATGVFGFASLCIFISCYQYIIDSYEQYAASALVGMTITRYVVGAALLPAISKMYLQVGVQNTLIVWAAVGTVLAPVPYWFYWRGSKIRRSSRRATDFGAQTSNSQGSSDRQD